jgi:hypothetical protein
VPCCETARRGGTSSPPSSSSNAHSRRARRLRLVSRSLRRAVVAGVWVLLAAGDERAEVGGGAVPGFEHLAQRFSGQEALVPGETQEKLVARLRRQRLEFQRAPASAGGRRPPADGSSRRDTRDTLGSHDTRTRVAAAPPPPLCGAAASRARVTTIDDPYSQIRRIWIAQVAYSDYPFGMMALAEPNARELDLVYNPPKDAKQVLLVARDGAHVANLYAAGRPGAHGSPLRCGRRIARGFDRRSSHGVAGCQ